MDDVTKRFEKSVGLVKARSLDTQPVRLRVEWLQKLEIAPLALQSDSEGSISAFCSGRKWLTANEITEMFGKRDQVEKVMLDFNSGLVIFVMSG